MIFAAAPEARSFLQKAITDAYRKDETACVENLLSQATFPPEALLRIHATATRLANGTRRQKKHKLKALSAFLHEYDLSSAEGIALMCLAEALLRIPDKATIDRLISDKISTASWAKHLHANQSFLVNAATRSLIVAGKLYAPLLQRKEKSGWSLDQLIRQASNALIRSIILQGMKAIGKQFVMGTTITSALKRAKKSEAMGYRYSYDMLGESAKTRADADTYFQSYFTAIQAIGHASTHQDPITGPGISIKLSALHPRYELAKRDQVLAELAPRLLRLAQAAKQQNIGLTVDAEEADRLELSLELIERVFSDSSLHGWEGFGLAVQSYQKRAPFVIDWLADLSKRYQRRLMVRLIKGAYWDTEIKLSQVHGLESYPVFTRKNSTDVSFIACAKKLLAQPEFFYPQFGTHNAYSVAAILELAGARRDFEFQCLHGMGQPLYDQIVDKNSLALPCRIYAPVGTHQHLLGYLVRRLLENGANSSFINSIANDQVPVEKIIVNPMERIASLAQKPHPYIPLPRNLFGDERLNSSGVDLSNMNTLEQLAAEMALENREQWVAGPIISGKMSVHAEKKLCVSPSHTEQVIGVVHKTTPADVENALAEAFQATSFWAKTDIDQRALYLERAADLFEKNLPRLITLLCREGGKQLADGITEVREAIDFCRYYAAHARTDLQPITLTGPTGEFNQLSLHPRGVIACISPWNFPIAIFVGQIVAALVAGNTVIAKPAEQTPLVAAVVVGLLHEAGIPAQVLQFLPGEGSVIGPILTADPRIAGVMFTGSTETAQIIQRSLAQRNGPIVPLIAETGGQNTMIVDSSALPEQVVTDVISSAFNSAGQRCSALRILFVQEEIAPKILTMLQGAMDEITLGDPSLLATDIGPVIDQDAWQMLNDHVTAIRPAAKLFYQIPAESLAKGYYFPPCIIELENLNLLKREVFGPILHVIRYAEKDLDNVLDQIIQTGYGLTLGIHSRIAATVKYIENRMPVGNIYVNRNMIGAVVGTQPFGGERLSGTGPKAGGPYYLPRLCVERAISINTTAAGGNATLVSLQEE